MLSKLRYFCIAEVKLLSGSWSAKGLKSSLCLSRPSALQSNFLADHFYSLIISAILANLMGCSQFTAVRASAKCGCVQLPNVRTSFVTSGFGSFSLWYCHFGTSLTVSMHVNLHYRSNILRHLNFFRISCKVRDNPLCKGSWTAVKA